MQKIRFGIIGTNVITDRFLKGALLHKDFELTAVYSRTEKRGHEFAHCYGVEHVFTNLEEMAKSDTFDAIYIASPNLCHAEQAILFMNHQKHVLCEKPLASNLVEVEMMIKAATENGVVLMEAMKTTLLPNFKVVRDNLHKLGTIRRYFSSFCQYSSRYDAYKAGTVLNAFKPELSNGALVDIGIYTIAPMLILFGMPSDIMANAYMLESGVDGQGSFIFNYPKMQGTVMYSKISNSHLPSEIQGEKGTLLIEQIQNFKSIKIIYRDGTIEDLSLPHLDDDMYYETEEFIACIQSGRQESSINSLRFSKELMTVLDEGRKQIGLVYPADLK
ncbi:MAG: Gfo/Idh/MocA family protein [Turicibacter sp.]